MNNPEKEETEGGESSPVGIILLHDQVEVPSHTVFDPFCIPYQLVQVPA